MSAHAATPTARDLPTVIDGPGRYRTRAGQLVTIDEIRTGNRSFFAAAGYLWRCNAGRRVRPRWAIWHVSGRHLAVGEDSRDVVAKELANASAA